MAEITPIDVPINVSSNYFGTVVGTHFLRSAELDQLSAALSAAQGEFEAVAKDAENPFFKSSYAPLPHVVAAASPILSDHGLAIWQGPDSDDRGEILWTVVLHKSGQYLGSAMRMRPVKADPQAQGSAISYARRYSYMAALGLVADEDDDGNAASNNSGSKPRGRPKGKRETRKDPAPTPAPPSDRVTAETLQQIKAAYDSSGLTPEDFGGILRDAGAGNTPISELSQDKAAWVLVALGEAVEARTNATT